MKWVVPVVLALQLGGCGGSEKKATQEPIETQEDSSQDEPQGDVLIPPEKMDEVARTFESKTSVVARCFVKAVDAGEVQASAKGFVTVGVTIQPSGAPTDIQILDGNIQSKTLKQCVIDYVGSWDYPQMPKAFTTSHIYRFQEL